MNAMRKKLRVCMQNKAQHGHKMRTGVNDRTSNFTRKKPIL